MSRYQCCYKVYWFRKTFLNTECAFFEIKCQLEKVLIFPMKNVQIASQYYIALEGTENGVIGTYFSVYPRVEYK